MFKVRKKGKTRGRRSKREIIAEAVVNYIAGTPAFQKELLRRLEEKFIYAKTAGS